MELPLPSSTFRRSSAQLRDIRARLKALRPMRSAGVLTGYTSQGVTRRPKTQTGGGEATGGAARWA